MLLLPLLLLSLASISSTKNATLPSSVVLVTPANGTAVNSSATVGLLDQDPSATGGYLRNVTFFISFPNGTSALIGNSFPMTCAPSEFLLFTLGEGGCAVNSDSPNGLLTIFFLAGGKVVKDNFTEFSFDGGAPGVYTLTANVDYGLPSGMNCSSPFHYQSLNVSESWT